MFLKVCMRVINYILNCLWRLVTYLHSINMFFLNLDSSNMLNSQIIIFRKVTIKTFFSCKNVVANLVKNVTILS